MQIKKRYILVFCSFLWISCQNNTSIHIDEKRVFRYNQHANISSLDPAFARTQSNIWAVNQLFNGLVQLDDSLKIQPDIAKKWNISPDGKKYIFTLRNDVFFHKNKCFFNKKNTRKVTAADFVYSFHRLKNPKTASSGGWILQNIKHFWAENDSIFSIELFEKSPILLGLLATKYASVIPKEAIDFYGNNFRKNPVGTGAFQFKIWKENTKLVLVKNSLYYEKDKKGKQLPYLDAISITFLPEKQSEFLQFIQGKLDFINGIDASYKDEILTTNGTIQPKYRQKIKMIKSPFLNTEYLGFQLNFNNEINKNKVLRKVISMGIDRKKMMQFLRNNIGKPAFGGFIPKGLHGFSEQKTSYNPQKAQQIVENFTKKNKKKPEITISSDANYLDICEFIQRELQSIGFTCKIDILPSAILRQNRATGKLQSFRASWIADYPDAENYLSLFYSKNLPPNGANYTHFKNDTFDYFYQTALNENNPNKRSELYQKMDSLLMEEAPIIPLYYDENVRFVQKNIYGFSPNPINLLQLKKVIKK